MRSMHSMHCFVTQFADGMYGMHGMHCTLVLLLACVRVTRTVFGGQRWLKTRTGALPCA